jgi:DNA-directed RNA polymerase specialized sigma subunit
MTYEQLRNLNPKEFKRLCGVQEKTFNRMVEVLQPDLQRTGKRGGQPKLSVEEQLLITLEYWREYRTYFHIGKSRGIHESTVCRIVSPGGRIVNSLSGIPATRFETITSKRL